jgi:hypothetical protein
MAVLRIAAAVFATVALAYSASAPAPKSKAPQGELSVTLEDGRVAVLNPDSTYTFKDGSTIPEDSSAISIPLGDGRTVRLLPDQTWQIGRNLKPYISRTVAVPLDGFSVSSTQDKGTAGKSEAAARDQVITKAIDKLAGRIKHPLVTRKLVSACLKSVILLDAVVMRAGAKTAVSAELTVQPSDIKKIKDCLDIQISAPPDTTPPPTPPAKAPAKAK